MLPWISPFRNALLPIALAVCFALATLAIILIDEPRVAAGPSERQLTNSREVVAIDALRLDRLVTRALPNTAPPLEEILESATVLAQAELIAPPATLISRAAPAAVTPTSSPAAQPPPTVRAAPPAAPAAATVPTASLPAPAAAEVRSTAAQPPAGASDARLDAAFTRDALAAVNALRANAGFAPLQADPALTSAAETYALDLAEARWFSHTGPDGSTMGDRLRAAGIVNVAAGEVLAMGSDGWAPDAVARTWLDSPPHRQIILGNFTRAGIACAFSHEEGSLVVRCVMELAA